MAGESSSSQRKRSAVLGFGVAALVFSVAVGEYSALVASRPNCLGGCRTASAATLSAWSATTVAAGLLAWVWWIRRGTAKKRERRVDQLQSVVGLMLAVLVVAALATAVWSKIRVATTTAPAAM